MKAENVHWIVADARNRDTQILWARIDVWSDSKMKALQEFYKGGNMVNATAPLLSQLIVCKRANEN